MLQVGCFVCSEFTMPHLHPISVTLTLCFALLLFSTVLRFIITPSNSSSEDGLSFDILLLSVKALIIDLK